MSTAYQLSGKYLGAMTHGVETCYLCATSYDADPLGPKTQFIFYGSICENLLREGLERKNAGCVGWGGTLGRAR